MDSVTPRIELPSPPPDQARLLEAGGVACWEQAVDIRTYEPAAPDPFPMFFDRRVYQGSSGVLYPLPFVDRIEAEPVTRSWRAIHLENRWVRLMLLPELGGRIHVGYDKTRGYDFFYRNNVIKPALVGLGGPWISGGVEFNWPQHHRPATYLPVETSIERSDDGAVTVWHSDVDPLQRMRGTHGVVLRPDDAAVEVVVRLFNRTDEPQTFLWWANVAAAVHEDYQSFFPTDVRYVADHARRAVTAFPQADRPYYGVDYPGLASTKPGADRLDRYSNIPVPTSYMITDTRDSFFGGYDHRAGAGFVHWADRNIAPGKKQWTWGDGPVGHAWDRLLTDGDGPYIELMAGVFTDNQPDFSYLAPGETRRFSQFWYPVQDVGVVHQATREAAVSVEVADGMARVGVAAARELDVRVVMRCGADVLCDEHAVVAPGRPHVFVIAVPGCVVRDELEVVVREDAREVVAWRRHAEVSEGEPWSATEPPRPDQIDTVDEALLTAAHLRQYRHPTRAALPYLRRALQIDPGDSGAHLALAELAHNRGEYADALEHLDAAAARMLRRNLNPRSGELHYRRGLTLERLGRTADAIDSYAKSAWDGAYTVPGHLGAARVLLRTRVDPEGALEHAQAAVADDPWHSGARAANVVALRRLGRGVEADEQVAEGAVRDPLDPLLASLGQRLDVVDPRTYLLVAAELNRMGESDSALTWADRAVALGATPFGNPGPVACYLRATVLDAAGERDAAQRERNRAAHVDRTLAFPAGLDDLDVLVAAVAHGERAGVPDATALGLLGCWLMGAGRGDDARTTLEAAIAAGADDAVVWRNAAIATANTTGDLELANAYLGRAGAVAGPLPRLAYERDLLARLREVGPERRLADLEASGTDLLARDDLAIAHLGLLVDAGREQEALEIVTTRTFQPFEGGEGAAIAVYDRICLAVAATLLERDPAAAAAMLDGGLVPPENLGEGRHPAGPLAARLVAAGEAHRRAGRGELARERWRQARTGGGPSAVAPRSAREDDYWVGVAHNLLGERSEAERVWVALDAAADELDGPARAPDYFATSLPDLLLFAVESDVGRRRLAAALRAAASSGRKGVRASIKAGG
ncbi:DUF5107 domain-containing protein [Cellulomonas sp. McL0617]|uniref:DUF5107 domain-containing protein n=1 Tax=Cellulomonas sp. McL0617 TaxID=3415675 RepID=UPI003CEC843E